MKRGKTRELSVQRMKFYPNKLFVTQEAGEQEDRDVTACAVHTPKYGQIRIVPRLFQASSRRHRMFPARCESSTAFPCLMTYICFSGANGFHLVVENVLSVSLICISSLALGD